MIKIIDHLPETHVPAGVRLYYTGLEAKLGPVFGPEETAMAVLPGSVHRSRCMVALSEGHLVGILGIHDARGSFLAPTYKLMAEHYGTIAGMYRTSLLMLLDSNVSLGDLYLDGIAVAPTHRGQGIGTALMTAFEQRARDNGFASVSLEVIDTNTRAKGLYTRLGYHEIATHSMGPFSRLFGFRTTCRMSKMVGKCCCGVSARPV